MTKGDDVAQDFLNGGKGWVGGELKILSTNLYKMVPHFQGIDNIIRTSPTRGL